MDLAWRPCDGRFDRLVQVTLRRLHRMMALGLAIFIVLHLMNHVMILFGPESHVVMMDILRHTYRHPVVEFALFAAFYAQIFIGLRLLWRRGKPRRFWGWIQAGSGITLSLFLLQHMSAVILTRVTFPDMPTDIYWAASVVSRMPLTAYFAPYYTIGVAALFFHLGAFAALRRQGVLGASLCMGGIGFAIMIVAGLMGAYQPITLSPVNEAYLDTAWDLPQLRNNSTE